MDEIFRQLGHLFVGSIPTALLFLLLLFCYTTLVHKPLVRTLATRRERTAGAEERAQAAFSLAEAKSQEYEAKLRAARLELNQGRERQVAGWNAARERTLGEAREQAAGQIRDAQRALEAEAAASRAAMEGSIDELAEQILRSVLSPAGAGEARS